MHTTLQHWNLNGAGLRASFLNWGARLARLDVETALGWRTVTLGFPTLDGFLTDPAHMGAIAGRYANRIGHGQFSLDGHRYTLPVSDRGNCLHGGAVGFGRLFWHGERDGEDLVLRHTSPDGDQGFPGTLEATVRYRLADGALVIDYTATTDAPTVLNLTNHAYFNLSGAPDILGHVLTIHADAFTPSEPSGLPTGEIRPVAGTVFDFRTPTAIGARIGADDEQLRLGQGYDPNYVLGTAPFAAPILSAELAASDLTMQVWTTEPAVQLYTGNHLAKAGFARHQAVCLETQHFPDSPNQPGFPSTVLRPGQVFRSTTRYRFGP